MPALGLPQLDGIWLSLPASDGLAALNAAVLLYLQIRAFKGKPFNFQLSTLKLLRLPHRIHYFAISRVAPYIPFFSTFQHEEREEEG